MISLALVGVGAAAWLLFWPRLALPDDPLAAVPGDAIGFVRVRVNRVIASDAYKRLVVDRGQARGIERVQVLCGFNPLERISELVVFARSAPGGGVPRLAFVARGELKHEELLDCVKKFTGGDASAMTYEDVEGVPTVVSKKGTSRAAFIGRDGLLGGDAESVRAAVHTLLKKAPSIAEEALLSGLYREVDESSDIALVTRNPDEAKVLIRELARAAAPELAALEPVRALTANLSTSGGRIAGGALFVTRDAQHASTLVALGKRAIGRLLSIPGVGLTPAAGVLRGVQMEAREDRATFAGSIKVSTVETLLELIPAIEQLANDLAPKPAAASEPTQEGGVAEDAASEAAPREDERAHRRRRARPAASAEPAEADPAQP